MELGDVPLEVSHEIVLNPIISISRFHDLVYPVLNFDTMEAKEPKFLGSTICTWMHTTATNSRTRQNWDKRQPPLIRPSASTYESCGYSQKPQVNAEPSYD